MPDVAIILGSESDLKSFYEAKVTDVFEQIGVGYELSVISAHRNNAELSEYVCGALASGIRLFWAIAGMAAALPGDVAAKVKGRAVVLGTPLPSSDCPNALDALVAMSRMPPGVPVGIPAVAAEGSEVLIAGVGVSGLKNTALLIANIAALSDEVVSASLQQYFARNTKPAKVRIQKSTGD